MLASGNGTVVYSRVIWAKTYLKQAGLLKSEPNAHVGVEGGGHIGGYAEKEVGLKVELRVGDSETELARSLKHAVQEGRLVVRYLW